MNNFLQKLGTTDLTKHSLLHEVVCCFLVLPGTVGTYLW